MATTNKDYVIPEGQPELGIGPAWLQDKRAALKDSFNSIELPKRGLQLWRYTDPGEFMFEPQGNGSDAVEEVGTVEALEKKHLEQGLISALVVDRGGRKIEFNGLDALASKGVLIQPLTQAAEQNFDMIGSRFYELVNSNTGKFEAMNGALWQEGIFIYVPRGTTVEAPVHLLRKAGAAGSTQHFRLLVLVEENAEFTLIDEYGGGSSDLDNQSFSSGMVELFAGRDSRVRYVSLQRQEEGSRFYLTHRAQIDSGAQMLTIPLAFGGLLSKQNFGVVLNGSGANSRMYGMLFGSAKQHFDNHTLHHHAAGSTYSDIDFKVVLRDKALSAYTGLIRIEQDATNCEAYQENRNLVLTPGARAETIPELEILNEEVSCSHGATVGPVDPLQEFYLRCRGIHEQDARRMIVSGFVTPTLDQVPDDLRARIAEFVASRLESI